jgi:hypothetical protein
MARFGLFLALLTEPVTARSRLALALGYIATRSAGAVVVMDALVRCLRSFVDRIEGGPLWHWLNPQMIVACLLQLSSRCQVRYSRHQR